MQPENMSHDLVFVTQMAELGYQHGEKLKHLFTEIQQDLDLYTTKDKLKDVSRVYNQAARAAYTESLMKGIEQLPSEFMKVILIKSLSKD